MKTLTVLTALSIPLALALPPPQRKQISFTVGQVVETTSGPVSGQAATGYSEVSEYLGIPYAQPPVGDLRFAAPVQYTGSELLNGSSFGNGCPQLPSSGSAPTAEEVAASNITAVGLELLTAIGGSGTTFSEDCLFLNVWTKPQCGEAQKAVMVFIHGGGFTSGSSSSSVFYGALLADQEDVIIVSLNYRLNVLGFPGNPNAQNNLALLDQRLVMEWVRDNIANFGGDPTRITLFGQSAGAISADYFSYAWDSDPIAAGIILESGTATSFGLPYPESTSAEAWYATASTVSCGDAATDPPTLLACMRNVELSTLLAAIPTTGINSLLSAFGPTVDDTLVFANYSEHISSIPVLVGNNDYEAGIFRTELALGGTTFPDALWDAYNLDVFTCPSGSRANNSVSSTTPVWRYRFFGDFPNIDISSEGGAYHGAELQLLFGTTFDTVNSTEEVVFEQYLRGAWTAFAKDPVSGLTEYEGGWPAYDPAEETLIRLAFDGASGTNVALPILYDAGCADANFTALVESVFG